MEKYMHNCKKKKKKGKAKYPYLYSSRIQELLWAKFSNPSIAWLLQPLCKI